MKELFVVILAFIFVGLYYGFLPSETIRVRGVSGEISTATYRVWVRSHGVVTPDHGVTTYGEPPYTFSIRIMPEDERAVFVELQDVLVYACGDSFHLFTYTEPLVYTVDYYDYKKPLAYYELNGSMACHENAIMDIGFTLRDVNKNPIEVVEERVLVEAYDRIPSTIGYWLSTAWDR